MEEEIRRDLDEEDVAEEDFEKAFKDLEEEDQNELDALRQKLQKIEKEVGDPNFPIDDSDLKKRVAKVCLKLVEGTPKEKTSIMETANIITGHFIWSVYGDDLDSAIELAGELELPEKHVEGDVFEKWEELKEMFEKYISE
jgi:hypothetical protein